MHKFLRNKVYASYDEKKNSEEVCFKDWKKTTLCWKPVKISLLILQSANIIGNQFWYISRSESICINVQLQSKSLQTQFCACMPSDSTDMSYCVWFWRFSESEGMG